MSKPGETKYMHERDSANNDKIDLEKAKTDLVYFAKKCVNQNIEFTEYQLRLLRNIDGQNGNTTAIFLFHRKRI